MDERPSGVSWESALSEAGADDRGVGGETTLGGTGAAAEDPELIREQIQETRAGMSETIDAIQERLSPEVLKEQAKEQVAELADSAKEKIKETVQESVQTAKDAVYDATIGKAGEAMQNLGETVGDAAQQVGTAIKDTGTSVVRTVRRNPLPVTLIGLGVGMLLLRRRRTHAVRYVDNYETDLGYEAAWPERRRGEKGVVTRAQSAVSDFVGGAQETVSNAASGAWDSVSNLAGQAGEQASNLGGRIQEGARRVQDQYERSLQENPLAVGAVALAAGAAVGLMLPSTRVEDRLMGETRENLTQKAEEAARDTFGKLQHVAGEAGRAARKEAEYQGLTGS